MRRWWWLLLCACGSTTSTVGDVRCGADGDCVNGDRCVRVTAVRVGTGDCLQSSGTNVCRPVCNDCQQVTPCGCQCP